MTDLENPPPSPASQSTHRANLPRSKTSALMAFILLLAVAATSFSAWQWLSTRQRFKQVEQALAQRLEQYSANNQQTIAISNRADERSTEAAARASSLEQRLAEFRSQQESLRTLYLELADNHEERVIAEVEQLMIIANQQLQYASNIKPALLALQTADSRLQALNTPQAIQLRKAIGQDIQRLQSLPQADIVGMSLKLESLIENINTLPLVSERHPSADTPLAPDFDSSPWQQIAQEIWQDIKGLIRIERIDQPELPLLSPDQSFFLRENIKLRLLTARISLLQRDEALYRSDLKAAESWLENHFDTREASTQNALSTISELSSSSLSIQITDISESLGLASRYKLTLDHGNLQGRAKPAEGLVNNLGQKN